MAGLFSMLQESGERIQTGFSVCVCVFVSLIDLSFSSTKKRVFGFSQFITEKTSTHWYGAYPSHRAVQHLGVLAFLEEEPDGCSLSFWCRVSEEVK